MNLTKFSPSTTKFNISFGRWPYHNFAIYFTSIDGRGPSSTPHERQEPNLERLEPSGERLEGERLEGGGERLGPLTRFMTKLRMGALDQATDGRENNMYMLHEGPLRVA